MKSLFTASGKRGLPPGSMVYTGKRREEPLRITVFDYDAESVSEVADAAVEGLSALCRGGAVAWINIDGLNDADAIGRIGTQFGIHPLVLEDILHTAQRPKLEDHGEYLFLVARMLYVPPEGGEIQSEQVSFILGRNLLLSFQEWKGDVFEAIRNRIRKNHGRVRRMGADYLLYALMDAIVDNYFLVLESMGERIEAIEQDMMANPDSLLLNELYRQKRELLFFRKSAWPLREAVGTLERGEHALLEKKTAAYMRDLYDHAIQVIDTVETFRDLLGGVQDLYLSCMGQKTNQVMQVLTVIATIFIPLTFVAGIYGMNFDHMPELHWKYGYASAWLAMAMIAAGMLLFFRRKKWF